MASLAKFQLPSLMQSTHSKLRHQIELDGYARRKGCRTFKAHYLLLPAGQ
jgi:hypothetical protein